MCDKTVDKYSHALKLVPNVWLNCQHMSLYNTICSWMV